MAVIARVLTKARWVLVRPDGRTLTGSKLPDAIECGVCGRAVKLSGTTGRVVCEHCRAHTVTVTDRASTPEDPTRT